MSAARPARPARSVGSVRRAERRRERLSLAQARRLALVAQGFDAERSGADGWALRRMVSRVALVQIDSVNVLQRAHYLPLFSRAGPYDPALLETASHRAPRRLFEYWGHEASLIDVTLQPLLRWRMERAESDAWGGMQRIQRERPELVAEVLARIAAEGPVSASGLEAERPRRSGPWWDWSDVKRACEFLFWSGQVTSARRVGFERRYDLPERVLPAAVLAAPTPSVEAAQRELLRVALRALGVAQAKELRDYFRLPAAETKLRIAELVEAGELLEVAVEGWRGPAYVDPAVRVPRRVDARALVGPFDSLIWERERVLRLFGFHFRLEIYVPAPQRVHGYYVLPFLLGDRLVARVDLKADRAVGALRVQAAWAEAHAPPETPFALADELALMAGWLGLGGVEVMPRGDLAPALAAAVGA